MNYSIMTMNVKNDTLFTRPKMRWNIRKTYILQMIHEYSPSIIGMQELTEEMANEIIPYLSEYRMVGKYRKNSTSKKIEGNPILFKKDIFTLVEEKTFWLSNTPTISGSKFLFSLFPRICTNVTLQAKDSLTYFHIYNTHLDHLLPFIRASQMDVLSDTMKAPLHGVTVLTGDFNTTSKSSAMEEFIQNSSLQSTYTEESKMNTFHYSWGNIHRDHLPIDYIFISDNCSCISTEVITKNYNGFYPSDHYPVLSVLDVSKTIL